MSRSVKTPTRSNKAAQVFISDAQGGKSDERSYAGKRYHAADPCVVAERIYNRFLTGLPD